MKAHLVGFIIQIPDPVKYKLNVSASLLLHGGQEKYKHIYIYIQRLLLYEGYFLKENVLLINEINK